LTQFHNLLKKSPPETQKTLLHTVVKQIHMKDRKKELEFDPTIQKHFFELAPSAKTVEGDSSFCDPKKLAPTYGTVHRSVSKHKVKFDHKIYISI
jgi:hypothetical protein